MTTCRHNAEHPCPWCWSQDIIWSGGCRCTKIRDLRVDVAGRTFRVREGAPDAKRLGCYLWPCSVALAQAVAEHNATQPLTGMRVVELGPGLGLPGMVAAHLGGVVMLADNCPNVRRQSGDCFDDNGLRAEHYLGEWKDLNSPFDAILGSDCVYDRNLAQIVAGVIKRCWTGRGPVLITEADRISRVVRESFAAQELPLVSREIEGRMMKGDVFKCNLWSKKEGAPWPIP